MSYQRVRALRVMGVFSCFIVLSSESALGQIAFDDVTTAAGIGPNATESFGASWGDFNGDGYPDLYSDNHREFGRLWQNNQNGTLTDISLAADVSKAFGPLSKVNKDTHGSAWADLDNDGDQDLALTVSTQAGHYLINDGAGKLTDRRVQLGLTLLHDNGSRMPVFFDSNNDGRLDAKIVGFRETASNFFRQNAQGTFNLIADSAGIVCPKASEWAQLLDVDGAGTFELLCGESAFPTIVTNYVAGTGIRVPFTATGSTHDAALGDFNNDSRQDILYIRGGFHLNGAVLVNPTTLESQIEILKGDTVRTLSLTTTGSFATSLNNKNWDYIIKGGTTAGIFIGSTGYHPTSLNLNLPPTGNNRGVQQPGTRRGMFIGYVNGAWKVTLKNPAGFDDAYLVVKTTAPIAAFTLTPTPAGDNPISPKLQLNTATGFVDATAGSGLTAERCVTGFAADLDNDMDLDIFLGCRAGPQNIADVVFENLGTGTFRKVSAHGAEGLIGSAITDGAGTTESVISADYDVDGFIDLFVTNGLNLVPQRTGGQAQLFRNRGNANHWLELDLSGVVSNRDGVGAKVYVTAGGVTQYREQNGGYHRWSQNHSRIHAGLGSNTAADVRIVWPSGAVDTYAGVAADALYRATEGQTTLTQRIPVPPPPI